MKTEHQPAPPGDDDLAAQPCRLRYAGQARFDDEDDEDRLSGLIRDGYPRSFDSNMHPIPANAPVIEFRDVAYALPNGQPLLRDLNLQVQRGETLVLLGRSGSGKTTTLKLVNRLLNPSGGQVWVNGAPNEETDVICLRRSIGYVIQDVGLFPHFTVERNIGLVPRIEGWPTDRIQLRVQELLQIVGLGREIASRSPYQLSGGQRQRVGVARALAADPSILLMDEPFGALDPLTRAEIRQEFQELQRKLRKTIVLVTHDTSEALFLGTRIALMEAGELRGVYSPREFLRSNEPVAAAYVSQLRELEKFEGKL